jgi:hypothetical protein
MSRASPVRSVKNKLRGTIQCAYWRFERSNYERVMNTEVNIPFFCSSDDHIDRVVIPRIKWTEEIIKR